MTEANTEELIFDAARSVFHEQGYGGARMQEIARRAGINQSMLHYYFRSKQKLFDAVFRNAVVTALPAVLSALTADKPLIPKIEYFVSVYLDTIYENPHLPGFIFEELRRNPQKIKEVVGGQTSGVFPAFASEVSMAVQDGVIKPIEPEQLLMNIISLCVFPIVGRPMLQTVTGLTDNGYESLLQSRKETVTRFIIDAIKV